MFTHIFSDGCFGTSARLELSEPSVSVPAAKPLSEKSLDLPSKSESVHPEFSAVVATKSLCGAGSSIGGGLADCNWILLLLRGIRFRLTLLPDKPLRA